MLLKKIKHLEQLSAALDGVLGGLVGFFKCIQLWKDLALGNFEETALSFYS